LFYLPRIFVNLAMVSPDSHAERERLLLMARKLYRFGSLLMVPALVLGLWLWLATEGVGVGRAGCTPSWCWWPGRSATTTCAAGCCVTSSSWPTAQPRWYRVFNEVTVLLFAATVVLVVVKPF
jgi:putative membrane protein